MDKKLILLILMFTLTFCELHVNVHADENTTNITNVTAPPNEVGCPAEMCSYFFGDVLSIQWIPDIIVVTGIGNCSLSHLSTGSIANDTYSFTCEIPYLNTTETQDFIFLLIDELNTEIKELRTNHSSLSLSKTQYEGTILLQWVIIIFITLFALYFVYESQF